MTVLDRESAKKYYLADIIYEMNLVKEKNDLYAKKYNISFEEFESKVKSEDENFEKWDDYIEWKAYNKLMRELQKKKDDLKNDDFRISD